MNQILVNRGELTLIPFSITDVNNGLLAKRVTFSVAENPGGTRVLRKVGGLPGSTADISITSQVGGEITGNINLHPADFDSLPKRDYAISLWVDDGAGEDRCVTVGGFDNLRIVNDVARTA